MTTPIHGHCHADFEPVREAFVRNFADYEQVGARISIIKEQETVVDLWGGYATEARDREWDEHTRVCCMSVTKGVVALCAHLLAERGLLDYDAPVARYWPEFAAAGKAAITVRQAISHQASLAFLDAAEPGDALNWATMIDKLGAQAPNWTVATNECYHSVTIGYITGELVRRIDGRPIEDFLREELTAPLGSDFVLGCADADLASVVAQIPNPKNEAHERRTLQRAESGHVYAHAGGSRLHRIRGQPARGVPFGRRRGQRARHRQTVCALCP